MKALLLLLTLGAATSAFSQTPTAASIFDGNYERREWRTKDRPLPDTDLTIKGTSGTFQQFASKKTRTDACAGKSVPIEVTKMDASSITFTVKLSQIMPTCSDFSATFQPMAANGKSGLSLPNSGEIMFVKK